jgi:zinc transporter, ZIP family
MGTAEILILGAVAGLTIFLGLPIARWRGATPAMKAFFTATATGILLFLFWDVLSAAVGPIESALEDGHGGRFAGLAALLTLGFSAGLLSLVWYDAWMKKQKARRMLGPGAASTAEFGRGGLAGLSPAQQLSVFIATGIGLHNFSEGLAIGQSAARDEIALAVVLIIGFGLHNATEGFGIVAPLSGDREQPSWGFLALLGLIGGGPTFFGTVVGQAWTSTALSVAFLALAAGSILYVVVELLGVCRVLGSKQLLFYGLLLGLVLGFGTDFILVAAGA